MKPYSKGESKFKVNRHDGIPGTAKAITKNQKLEVRNANRSLKKRERQAIKKEIKKLL